MSIRQSGQAPFVFSCCEDLRRLPPAALAQESRLHGGFAIDKRPGYGHLYYGMVECGLLRISPDLTIQEIIDLPPHLRDINFHSTKIAEFEGKPRLFLPANNNALVAIVSLEGDVEMMLTRPELAEYQAAEQLFKPTDTLLVEDQLLVADGYGSNYISTVDLATHCWVNIFGGKSDDPHHHGRFGTAHGINLTPHSHHLAIADRPHSRIAVTTTQGEWVDAHPLPSGSRPCGIDFTQWRNEWFAVVGSLDDPEKGRPAPIYILNRDYQVISTIRPKEDLGIEQADHIHNVVWHQHSGRLFLVVQSWNPGRYFVLEHVA